MSELSKTDICNAVALVSGGITLGISFSTFLFSSGHKDDAPTGAGRGGDRGSLLGYPMLEAKILLLKLRVLRLKLRHRFLELRNRRLRLLKTGSEACLPCGDANPGSSNECAAECDGFHAEIKAEDSKSIKTERRDEV